jgi:nitroreductase
LPSLVQRKLRLSIKIKKVKARNNFFVRSFLKISDLIKRPLKALWAHVRKWVFQKGISQTIWARVYYFYFNPSFGREQSAVLAGRACYEKTQGVYGDTAALVRRNVHRLEKGLLMRPRRVPFALDYLEETVQAFSRAASFKDWDPEEKRWASDVLAEYFRVHASRPETVSIQALFEKSKRKNGDESSFSTPCIPYQRNLDSPLPVTLDQLKALAVRRRSVRWFQQKPVDRALVDHALEIGAQAPSACNRQPFIFRIFDHPDLVRKVVAIPFGTAGYRENIPVVAVVVGQQRHFFCERDRHLIYIDASLAVMGFLYGLEVQGLSSCCINWPDVPQLEEEMGRLLRLQPDERPIMLVAIGYPDPEGMVAASQKKSLNLLRSFNFE